jgi:RecB family exonuclease
MILFTRRRAFDGARKGAWYRPGKQRTFMIDEHVALRLLRSPASGVPHDVAAALAVVAAHVGGLRQAIARERLALGADDRDAVFAFAKGLEAFENDPHAFPEAAPRAPAEASADAPIALAIALEREPGAPLRARQPHFSASALNAYADCARKWYYRYTCNAVEDRGSSASYYGTAFHTALEYFHETFVHPEPAHESAMRQHLRGDIARAFEGHREDFETAVEYELQVRRAQRTAQRYVTWLVAKAKRSPFTIVGRELHAAMKVGGYDFIGFIDRLDRDDETGNVAIVDYKTGAIAESAAEYRERVRTFHDFQLPFYYWAREAEGDRVATLSLIPLKDASADVRPIELEVVPVAREDTRRGNAPVGTIGIADLERARTKMGELCRSLSDGSLEAFPASNDPSACTYCAYKLACNDRPATPEERFAR